VEGRTAIIGPRRSVMARKNRLTTARDSIEVCIYHFNRNPAADTAWALNAIHARRVLIASTESYLSHRADEQCRLSGLQRSGLAASRDSDRIIAAILDVVLDADSASWHGLLAGAKQEKK
jgi:hypothetical protein